jgi:hypothetical protein
MDIGLLDAGWMFAAPTIAHHVTAPDAGGRPGTNDRTDILGA